MGKNTKNESQISAKLMHRSSVRFMGAKTSDTLQGSSTVVTQGS